MARFVLALVLLSACADPSEGRLGADSGEAAKVTRSVCAGGYTTIQAAINAATSGDVISICAGTYKERLTISKSLTLQSVAGSATTILDAQKLGRAIAVSGGATVSVVGLTVQSGKTSGDGGGISCSSSTLTITSSRLTGNKARYGGGLWGSSCAVTITDTDFDTNVATSYGGGAYFTGSTGTVSLSSFEANDATRGGGLWISGSGLTIDENTFTANEADHGGGIYLAGKSTVSDNVFEDNVGSGTGGAITLYYGDGIVSGNTFTDNTSGGDGGGMFVDHGAAQITGNTFTGNDAGDDGGGLRLKTSTASVTDNDFTANTAVDQGGGLKVSHRASVITGSTFTSNTAGNGGGALSLDESASTLSDVTFTSNSALMGGGVYVYGGWDPVEIEDCTFTTNAATSYGGAVHAHETGAETLLTRVVLSANTAPNGAGVYAETAEFDIANTLFTRNVATTQGAAIQGNGLSGSVWNSVVYGNSGLPVYLVNNGALTVENTILSENLVGAAVTLASGTTPTWKYNNNYLNASEFSGMANPVGTNGNLAANPYFKDAPAGNFVLRWGSTVRNAGDPAVFDADGTRSDLGIYGGPNGSGW